MRLLVVLVVLVTSPALASDKPGLAALNVKAERGVDASLATLISEAILSELKASSRFASVIGSSDMQTMIDMEQQKQALGCDENTCLAQLGGALGVPYLLSGSLGSVGGQFMLNLKIIQVEESRVAERKTHIFDSEKALVRGLKSVLTGLVSGALDTGDDETEPEKQILVMSQSKRLGPWVGGGLATIGTGLALNGYLSAQAAQSDYDASPTVARSRDLENAVSSGNTLISIGLGAVGAGIAALVWLR